MSATRTSALPFAAAIACACIGLPRVASAQSLYDMVSLRVEGGLGSMLSSHQRDTLGYTGVDGWAALRIGALLYGPIGVQASGAMGFYPSDQGLGQLLLVSGGVRVEPVIPNTPVRILLDVNAGPGWTGPVLRPALEAGVGVELSGRVPVAIGVSARYVHVFQDRADPFPQDAMSLFGVLHFALRMPPHRTLPPAPPPVASEREVRDHDADGGAGDLDGDGVIDMVDLCPDVPMGNLRDTRRLGCPRPDSDHDGIPDSEDNCPAQPPGEHPDPHHSGCPESDVDHDGVADRYDVCPDQAIGLYPDADRGGCPRADRDRDLVPDATDHCVDRAGAPDRRAAHNGCPGAVIIEDAVVRFASPWTFLPDESAIPASVQPGLNALASAVRVLPPGARILVSVTRHGSSAALSRTRAQSLVDYFVARRMSAGLDDSPPESPANISDGTPVIRIGAVVSDAN